MDIREKLVELLDEVQDCGQAVTYTFESVTVSRTDNYGIADHLIDHGVTVQEGARPIEEWHEDFGDVLWWKFPIEEPPYVGSPLDEKWPGYHTHWTFIPLPQPPKGE